MTANKAEDLGDRPHFRPLKQEDHGVKQSQHRKRENDTPEQLLTFGPPEDLAAGTLAGEFGILYRTNDQPKHGNQQ